MIAPFFIVPFVVQFGLAYAGFFTGHRLFLMLLGIVLSVWGGYVVYLILRNPLKLATEANHVSWKHMYLIMLVGQLGTAFAYLFPFF
jgi:hypothetical protein